MSDRFLIKLMKIEMAIRKRFKTGRSERGTWWGVAALVVGVVGAGVSAYGSYASGQAQKKSNQYAADVAEQQAKLTARTAEQNITATQINASMESKQHARKMLQLEGAQKATEGAMGIPGSVSASDIGISTFNTGKLDEMAIRYNADYKSWAMKNQADFTGWDLSNQRNQYLMAGRNAAAAGNIGAASSLLQGASSAMGTYGYSKSKATKVEDTK